MSKTCVCCRHTLPDSHFPNEDGKKTNICKTCWIGVNATLREKTAIATGKTSPRATKLIRPSSN